MNGRLLNMPTEMPLNDALFQAKNILEEEANQLVMARDAVVPPLPHRILIAIEREIVRLRLIARTLELELPKKTDEEE